MARRSRRRASAPPAVDPRIELLAQALIAILDAQGIPLADVGRLWPDIAGRIEQEARDREARRLAEIDARRRVWAEEHGLVDAPTLTARLGLDARELATAERLGYVAQREWPPHLRLSITGRMYRTIAGNTTQSPAILPNWFETPTRRRLPA